MTIHHFTRRLHLYLAMLLLPWVVMYGVSSLPFSHADFFSEIYGKPEWTTRFERRYQLEIPPDADLRQIGAKIMRDNGLEGNFGTYRPDENVLHLYLFTFWTATQVDYYPEERRLIAKDKTFRWDHFLTGMHARGGFEQDSLLSDAWGVAVDLVCVGMLVWIATGLYMWWKLRQTRVWGWLALGAGVLSFVLFVAAL